jgi:aspartate dehydrogenase
MTSREAQVLGPFMRVGVVGCGRVGSAICRAIDRGAVRADLTAVSDTKADRCESLVFSLARPVRSMSLPGLAASVDLVVEATNRHVAPVVMMAALNAGKDLLVTNPAALFARDDFARLAFERGLTIFAVNALLTGGSALSTAAAAPGATVNLTLTCPPAVLADAPFLRGRELPEAGEPQLVFQGAAPDAISAFPRLANLAAAAVIGAGDTELLVRVQVHGQPDITEIDLDIRSESQHTTSVARVASADDEPVHPEVIGMAAVGVLRSLVSSLRLA